MDQKLVTLHDVLTVTHEITYWLSAQTYFRYWFRFLMSDQCSWLFENILMIALINRLIFRSSALLFVTMGWVGFDWVQICQFAMGWFGLGHSVVGLGWVGLWKMDPWTTPLFQIHVRCTAAVRAQPPNSWQWMCLVRIVYWSTSANADSKKFCADVHMRMTRIRETGKKRSWVER